ncbi:N-6 DNA methylase [Rhizobium leguminosarum]|uniref:N-6 DNA methylase n=1 Tax=Rhizobium leguminosarum TaxID=384 RepID=UPI00103261F1|nr:N-6 DNA methylase [Rhizobium leguminosarum]TAX28919.1 restriction endonuclease subunit M/S [Rhizobium leguminosarum]
MLDKDTKRRIDTCRDILVGKVPDPKSQVEQITVALIYKFMDDMDLEAEEMGGERKFFTQDYERYRWAKLVAPGVSGQEMLNTYSEALTKMVENDHLPALFRSIFRNAYLPYRDPETLRSFLREIDSFTYDHSERLGDAFEYLLSVLGSQGDAGQFRTPRHIIDFMVEIIDPKKNEVILDPACGTAGFLISAYKHILKANSSYVVNGNGKHEEADAAEQALESPMRFPGDQLSPEDRSRLAGNIKGYDISPDMVRLSLVNLYLHGFADPKVEEYDTLTSEEKWTQTADVILANPPFMSPKGGIKPHTRFQVQSKRSEVLFVDYIAEHLNPNGRAAIVVPEGIIFQSQSAYIALRKMLVDGYLAAVISLPAGVFNPYSGVKTSILILDRAVAKASAHIAFFKIENDGFALGAQRKAVKGSQLAQVKSELGAWLQSARVGAGGMESDLGSAVEREVIAAGGDYNLSVERYGQTEMHVTAFPLVPLSEIASIQNGFAFKSSEFSDDEGVPIIRIRDIKTNKTKTGYLGEYDSTYLVSDGDLLVGMDGEFNSTIWSGGPALLNQRVCKLQSFNGVLKEYVALLLPRKLKEIENATYAVTVKHISAKQILGIEIPLPPLEVQRDIVDEIESYQRVIDGARAVIDSYCPRIPIDPEWPVVQLGDASQTIMTGPFGTSLRESDYTPEGFPVINPKNIINGRVSTDGIKRVATETLERLSDFKVSEGDVIIGRRGEMGRCAVIEPEMNGWLCGTGCFVIRPTSECDPRFLALQVSSAQGRLYLDNNAVGVTMKNLNQSVLAGMPFLFPSLHIQEAVVAAIQAEQTLVNGNRELLTRFQTKIAAAIDRVWGARDTEAA